MKYEVKLPKSYYQYADIDLLKLDKNFETEKISISLSSFISCKLEQLALFESLPIQEVLKKILIEEGILDLQDVVFSGRTKATSKFAGIDCNTLKDIGTSKLHRISLTEYAKAKILKKMIELNFDLSFFIKKSMAIKLREKKRDYHIIEISEIGM